MPQPTKDPYIFKKKIANEIPIYYNHLEWSPCVHIGIGFKVGGTSDPAGKEGIAHFLEHAIFNGSPLLPDKKTVRAFKKKYTLDSFNARTGYCYTEYTAQCLPANFSKTAEGLFDLILHPTLDEKESTQEKKIIIQELWDRLRNEKYKAYLKNFIQNTRHGLSTEHLYSPGGWPETVSTVSNDDLKEWHREHYHKGNMYVLLAGSVTEEHISLIEKLLLDVPSGIPSPHQNTLSEKSVQLPLIKNRTYTSEEIGMEQEHATLTILINTKRNIQNEEVLNLSSELLGTILFEILREEMALCYHVDCDIDPELEYVENYISLNLPASKIDAAEKNIFDIIQKMTDGAYRHKFEEEKKLSIDRLKARERTANMIMGGASNELVYQNKIPPLSETIEKRESVTYEEVASYIGNTFTRENVYIERIIP